MPVSAPVFHLLGGIALGSFPGHSLGKSCCLLSYSFQPDIWKDAVFSMIFQPFPKSSGETPEPSGSKGLDKALCSWSPEL